MNLRKLNRLLLLLIVNIMLTGTVCAQSLSGLWMLKSKTTLYGTAYDNALPIRVKITDSSDSLHIQRLYIGKNGYDTIVESLSKNSRPVSFMRSDSEIRMASFNWIKRPSSFKINVAYKNKAGDSVLSTFIETWELSESNHNLSIERIQSKQKGGASWSANGQFESVTQSEWLSRTATGNGIDFQQALSWQEIIARAKKENKYIFVDCYTTWCGPCKKMEREVYDLNSVRIKIWSISIRKR